MKRLLLLSAIVTAAGLGSTSAWAQNYPWCAYLDGGDDGGGTNCGFVSREQCMASVIGIGGFCTPNNTYVGTPSAPASSYRQKSRRY